MCQFNKNNFFNSLNKQNKKQKELKDVIIENKLIKNVPVLKNNNKNEDFVNSYTLAQIYYLIKLNPQDEIIYFK